MNIKEIPLKSNQSHFLKQDNQYLNYDSSFQSNESKPNDCLKRSNGNAIIESKQNDSEIYKINTSIESISKSGSKKELNEQKSSSTYAYLKKKSNSQSSNSLKSKSLTLLNQKPFPSINTLNRIKLNTEKTPLKLKAEDNGQNQTIITLQKQLDALQSECNKLTTDNKVLRNASNKPSTSIKPQNTSEQETLIKGYQLENERLVTKVKELKLDTDTKRKLTQSEKLVEKLSRELESTKMEVIRLKGRTYLSDKEKPSIQTDLEVSSNEKDIVLRDLTDTVNELNQILAVKDALIFSLESDLRVSVIESKIGSEYSKSFGDIDKLMIENVDLKTRIKAAKKKADSSSNEVSKSINEIEKVLLENVDLKSQFDDVNARLSVSLRNESVLRDTVKSLNEDIEYTKTIHSKELDALKKIHANRNIEHIVEPVIQKDVTLILKHNIELEKLVTEQDIIIQQSRSLHTNQTHSLRTQLEELQQTLNDTESINISLKKKLHYTTYLTDEQTYLDKISTLQASLDLSETHLSKLRNQ